MGKKKHSAKSNDKVDKNKLKKQTIIQSIASAATVTDACEAVKCSREAYYTWYHTDKKFKKAIDVAKASRVQAVEGALFKSALSGNITAQIFFLCNRAKNNWESINKVEHFGNLDHNVKVVISEPKAKNEDNK